MKLKCKNEVPIWEWLWICNVHLAKSTEFAVMWKDIIENFIQVESRKDTGKSCPRYFPSIFSIAESIQKHYGAIILDRNPSQVPVWGYDVFIL